MKVVFSPWSLEQFSEEFSSGLNRGYTVTFVKIAMDNANGRVIVQQELTPYLNKSKAVISRREGEGGDPPTVTKEGSRRSSFLRGSFCRGATETRPNFCSHSSSVFLPLGMVALLSRQLTKQIRKPTIKGLLSQKGPTDTHSTVICPLRGWTFQTSHTNCIL